MVGQLFDSCTLLMLVANRRGSFLYYRNHIEGPRFHLITRLTRDLVVRRSQSAWRGDAHPRAVVAPLERVWGGELWRVELKGVPSIKQADRIGIRSCCSGDCYS